MLKDVIRYIVLCKGIPLKVKYSLQLGWDWKAETRNRVSVDALLCLINQPTGRSFITLFEKDYDDYNNPYYNVDPRFTMDYRFISNYFVNQEGWYLQYLVSRLDGDDFDDVITLIDSSTNPDMSGNKYWIIDDDPEPLYPEIDPNLLEETHLRLNYLDFNLNPEVYVSENDWIWHNQEYGDEKVIGYVSYGTHAPMPILYILEVLEFDYANGAIFSSIESFNGFSFGETRAGHGLVSDFIHMGGTCGVGNVYEPFVPGAGQDELIFPAYSLGYSVVDAIYQGIPKIAWQNTVVGDPLTMIYNCQNTVISSNTTIDSRDYNCDVTVPPGVTLTIESGDTVNFNRNCNLKVFGNLEILDGSTLNFNGYSSLEMQGNMTANGSEVYITFNELSRFELKSSQEFSNMYFTFNDETECNINENITVNAVSNYLISFNDESKFGVNGTFNTEENGTLHFNNQSRFNVYGTLNVNENSSFNFSNISKLIVYNLMNIYAGAVLNFNDDSDISVEAFGSLFSQGESSNNVIFNFTNSSVDQFAYRGNETLLIDNTTFNNGEILITKYLQYPGPDYCSITNSTFNGCKKAIKIYLGGTTTESPVIISNSNFTDIDEVGVEIINFSDAVINISKNVLVGYSGSSSSFGIYLMNGNEASVSNNSLSNYHTGILVNSVTHPFIIDNIISAEGLNSEPFSGIVFNSSNGEIRKNTIQYHSYGIELGGSSPKIAENTITNNDYYGIYISSGSFPDLGQTLIGPAYPVTGYNEIRENGVCGNDNSEIYFYEANADLSYGCNTIADDRENDPGMGCDYTLLMDGEGVGEEIFAEENYWGDHPVYGHDPSQRFGEELYVEYEPYLEDPCTFGAGGSMLVMTTSQGIVIDTVYSSGPAPIEMTDLESRYSTANEYYYDNMYSEAKEEYQQIVQNYADDIKSVHAYNKLYSIEKIVSSTPEPFNDLRTFYLGKLNTITDSTLIGTLTHLSNLCLVASEEYRGAIDNFDEIVQENPNTDLALYRQIDALTTALLIPPDSTLGKGTLVKYSVSDISEYTNRVNELLKNRGRKGTESLQQEIPEEYFLYQNYPNPFNPITTIKFDLPEAGNLELVVYDILGRRVRTLLNEKREAGRYEVNWDASDVASGIYIYQLRAGDYVDTKKMILLK